jgi:transcriptional regulator with XRE-family HTH domain
MKLPRLKEWRERRGFTQPELAESAGVNPSTIWRIEAHDQDARPSTARKLAGALGVHVEDLMGLDGVDLRSGRPLIGKALGEALKEADERDGWRGQQLVLEEQMAKVDTDHPLYPIYQALHVELEMLYGGVRGVPKASLEYGRAAGRFYVALARATLRLVMEGKQVPAWMSREAYRELAS